MAKSDTEYGEEQAKAARDQGLTGYLTDSITTKIDYQQALDQQALLISQMGDQIAASLEAEVEARIGGIEGYDKLYTTYQAANEAIDAEEQYQLDSAINANTQAITEIGYQAEELTRNFERNKIDAGYATDNLTLQEGQQQLAIDNLGLDKDMLGIDFDMLDLDIDNTLLSNENLTEDIKNQSLQALNLMNDFNNLGLDKADIQEQLKAIGFDKNSLAVQNAQKLLDQQNINRQIANYGFDKDIINNQIRQTQSQIRQLAIQNSRSLIQERMRRDQFGTDMTAQSIEMSKQAADARLGLLKTSLKTQASKGSSAASGRRGKSVKALQSTAETLGALDAGQIADNLLRANFSFQNYTNNLTKQNQKAARISRGERRELAQTRKQKLLDLDNLSMNKDKIDNQIGIAGNEILKSRLDQQILSNENQKLDTQANRLGIRTDQLTNNQLSNLNNQQAISNNITKIGNQIEQNNNQISKLEAQQDKLITQSEKINNEIASSEKAKQVTANKKAEIAEMLGLTLEEYESETDQLSDMLMDTVGNFETVIDSIKNDALKERVKLYNGMALPPRSASLPLDPLKPIELGEYMAPIRPYLPDQDTFIGPTPPSQNKGGGFLSAGLGIAAAVAGGFIMGPVGPAAALSGVSTGYSIGSSIGDLFRN